MMDAVELIELAIVEEIEKQTNAGWPVFINQDDEYDIRRGMVDATLDFRAIAEYVLLNLNNPS